MSHTMSSGVYDMHSVIRLYVMHNVIRLTHSVIRCVCRAHHQVCMSCRLSSGVYVMRSVIRCVCHPLCMFCTTSSGVYVTCTVLWCHQHSCSVGVLRVVLSVHLLPPCPSAVRSAAHTQQFYLCVTHCYELVRLS